MWFPMIACDQSRSAGYSPAIPRLAIRWLAFRWLAIRWLAARCLAARPDRGRRRSKGKKTKTTRGHIVEPRSEQRRNSTRS